MYRQYQIFTDYTVDESWILYHIEMAMAWCLHYHEPQIATLSEDLRVIWSTIKDTLDLKGDLSHGEMLSAPQENHEQLPEADQAMVSIVVQSFRDRIIRNSTKAKFLEVGFAPPDLPNIGPVNRTDILEHILCTAAREIPRFTQLFAEVKQERVAQILEEGVSPAVRRICDQGLFDIDR